MRDEQIRCEFEAWHKEHDGMSLMRHPHGGEYVYAESNWQAWQFVYNSQQAEIERLRAQVAAGDRLRDASNVWSKSGANYTKFVRAIADYDACEVPCTQKGGEMNKDLTDEQMGRVYDAANEKYGAGAANWRDRFNTGCRAVIAADRELRQPSHEKTARNQAIAECAKVCRTVAEIEQEDDPPDHNEIPWALSCAHKLEKLKDTK